MAEPFLSEIKIFSFGFNPKGWALCNGQLLPINQNQGLFSLLGTTYGGDGRVNFALPNLQGRLSIGVGNGHTLGERGGEQAHTLSINEMGAHGHSANVNTGPGTALTPDNKFWANDPNGNFAFGSTPDTALSPKATTSIGGSQPHLNIMPFLTLTFCIALQGSFPTQN